VPSVEGAITRNGKVDTDVLSIHRGLLLFVRGLVVRNPESGPTRFLTRSGGPAPSSHQIWVRAGSFLAPQSIDRGRCSLRTRAIDLYGWQPASGYTEASFGVRSRRHGQRCSVAVICVDRRSADRTSSVWGLLAEGGGDRGHAQWSRRTRSPRHNASGASPTHNSKVTAFECDKPTVPCAIHPRVEHVCAAPLPPSRSTARWRS
jgi:hypothetical protein